MARSRGPAFAAVVGLAAARLMGPAVACADPADDPPDPAFLEYLGSWQGDDDAWVVLAPQDGTQPHAAHADPAPPAPRPKDPAPERPEQKIRSHDD